MQELSLNILDIAENSVKAGASPVSYTHLITYPVFLEALKEAVGMSVIVFIVSNLVGNRAGAAFMAKYCAPEKDNPYFCRVMRQAGTILVMCPLMSLIASILFQIILGGQPLFRLPAIWIGTVSYTHLDVYKRQ